MRSNFLSLVTTSIQHSSLSQRHEDNTVHFPHGMKTTLLAHDGERCELADGPQVQVSGVTGRQLTSETDTLHHPTKQLGEAVVDRNS